VIGVLLRRDSREKNRRQLRAAGGPAVLIRMVLLADKISIEIAFQKPGMRDDPAMEVEVGAQLS
jgi:predicted transcriptional regulator of viral defense system